MTANCTDFPFVLCSFSSAVFFRNILLSHHISNPSTGWVITLLCLGLFPSDCATIYSVLFFPTFHSLPCNRITLLHWHVHNPFSPSSLCHIFRLSHLYCNFILFTKHCGSYTVSARRCCIPLKMFCCFFICILLLHGGTGNHQKRLEQKICGFKSFLSRCLEWAASSRRASRKV